MHRGESCRSVRCGAESRRFGAAAGIPILLEFPGVCFVSLYPDFIAGQYAPAMSMAWRVGVNFQHGSRAIKLVARIENDMCWIKETFEEWERCFILPEVDFGVAFLVVAGNSIISR